MLAVFALYCLDALVLGQGFVAAGLLLAVAFGLVPKWFVLRAIGRPAPATARLALAMTVCAIAIMLTINLNNQLARERGNALVAAIEHYRAMAGHYPRRLEDLVPRYIEAVPLARYTLSFNRFDFLAERDRILLAYAVAPPFGREVFDFHQQRWLNGGP